MAELVQGENKHSDCSLSGPNFAIWTTKMDRSQTEFSDLCSWKDIQKKTFILFHFLFIF